MDASYIAGLVDGEGCFSITKHVTNKGPNRFDLHPYCSIALKQKWLLEEIKEFFGFGFVRKKKSHRKNQSDTYEFVCRSQSECLLFCNRLMPYLVLKKDRAILLKSFLESRINQKPENNKAHTKPYTKAQLDFYLKLKKLNSRGGKL